LESRRSPSWASAPRLGSEGNGRAESSAPAPVATTTAGPEPAQTFDPTAPAPAEQDAPAESVAQENARATAEDFLATQGFSRKILIAQSKYEGFSTKDATYAVGAIAVDWNEHAAKTAKDYLDAQSFSRCGLVEQLEYEGFTHVQAEYGVSKTGF
jgi:host cell surface-exposed lipoprotein